METIWGAGVLVGAELFVKIPQANAAGRSSAYTASFPHAPKAMGLRLPILTSRQLKIRLHWTFTLRYRLIALAGSEHPLLLQALTQKSYLS